MATTACAQAIFPQQAGERMRFAAMIEMPKAYISGVCIMVNDNGVVKGSLFNEFGLSALDFSYDIAREKVKLYDVMDRLDKWYIKRQLRKDLRQLFHQLQLGNEEYRNERQKITYRFTPMTDDSKK